MSNQGHDIVNYQWTLHCQGKGWWEGRGAAAKIASFAGAPFAGEPGTSTEEFRETLTLFCAKRAGAACAERDQH